MNKLKMKWLRKLAATRNFVVMTDKEFVISIKGLNPDDMDDIMAVANQQATLEAFREKLGDLIKEYEKNISKQMAVPGGGSTKKKVTKIKVKQG